MSNSGFGFDRDAQLRVAVSLPLLIAVIAELSTGSDDARSLGAALAAEMPGVILTKVQTSQDEGGGL